MQAEKFKFKRRSNGFNAVDQNRSQFHTDCKRWKGIDRLSITQNASQVIKNKQRR